MLGSRFGATLLMTGALYACSNQDAVGVPVPLAECPDADYTTCDTQDEACQARLLELAACIYGVPAPAPVPVRVLTEEQLLDELAGEPDDAETQALQQRERALVDLRLLKSGALSATGGATADLVTRISGVYQDAERGVVLVDRGDASDSAEADALLVHELVHALQDDQYGLATWRQQYPAAPDTELALRSITEGQATLVQYRAWAAMSGHDAKYVDWESTFLKLRNQLFASARADDSPYFASSATFPYGFGVTLANVAWAADGQTYHVGQFANPPQSTLEVLAPNAQQPIPQFSAAPFQEPEASDGYQVVDDTVLGAFLLALSAHRLGDDSADPLPLLLAWRGDRLWSCAGPDEQASWLWQIQVDDAATAQALQGLADDNGLTSQAKQGRVFVLGGDEPPAFLLDAGRAFLDATR